jgi:cathepsin L
MGHHTYTLGMNAFGDMTNEEFKAAYLGTKKPEFNASHTLFLSPLNVKDLPDTVDWRTQGYVTGVKDQGQCGSCWSFSATGSLEGQYFHKSKTLVSFSEQQLVDCSGEFGNQGCNGGLMDQAFDYIKKYGIEKEEDYPYTARDGKCKYASGKTVTTVSGYTDIPTTDEAKLKEAVATVGPVSVAIDASHLSFQLYRSGVYNEKSCSQTQLDHGVLAVGYGAENGNNYWLVKNSWGGSWGQKGYIFMSRDKNNQCGIATAASYPLM